ncbi:MAG: protein-methionine-sulfoxide reductase catalytic subunit MsrP [Gammaproteobacteria bacterium]|nr:protein-methionine-sulfoxide reductase catalytic subunit MsrP [Gammaproteobacteria bacterium]
MPIKSSTITPEKIYKKRRTLIAAGLGVLALPIVDKGYAWFNGKSQENSMFLPPQPTTGEQQQKSLELTPLETITGYNNYYEFGYGKDDPAKADKTLITSPWTVEIGGVGADKPGLYDIADIKGEHAIENHIYRFRCVEAWSMVIPWNGIKLADMIKAAKPNSRAKYVRFITLNDTQQMPNAGWANGPYVEGLTIEEAMNPLTLMATGVYDKPLEQQNGAPIRLVVPWKYGFKSSKSIVKIELVEHMPQNTWWKQNDREYGFYANVNPQFDHPRWSQATERVIGKTGRQPTLLFNGYANEVAHLYPDKNNRLFFY